MCRRSGAQLQQSMVEAIPCLNPKHIFVPDILGLYHTRTIRRHTRCAPAVAVAASSAEGTASIPNTKALTSMASVMQAERRDPETDTRSPRTPPLGKAALMHILQPLYPTSQGSYAADVLGDVNVSDTSFHGISGAPFFVVGQGEQDGSRPRTVV